MTRSIVFLAALALATSGADAASALTITSPVDGEDVSSRPTFTVDGDPARGSLTVEVSKSPDLRTAGDGAGTFVDKADDDIAFFGDDPALPLTAVRWGPSRLNAGTYYWHGLIETYDERPKVPWSPVLKFTVADEPAIFTGWTLRADRLRKRAGCPRVRLRGAITFEDNDASPQVAAVLTVKGGGRTLKRAKGTLDYSGDRFDVTVCTRAAKVSAAVALTDRGGNRTDVPSRTVRVRSG